MANTESVQRPEEGPKASSSVPPPPPPPPLPPWIELPPEITADILQRLGAVEILDTAQKVCTTWWKASKDPAIWRKINMSCEADDEDHVVQKEMMCRRAVDRSQGQVTDIKVTDLGIQSADLIGYIAERSNQLRCLSLEFCYPNTPINCVIEAVKKLPSLEEFHLDVIHATSDSCRELIETAGKSCHLLKSFTLNRIPREVVQKLGRDDVALAVAEWMPELRHLGLAGDLLTNDGLTAVLDGCMHLESLHLRRCFGLRIEAELARRCSQQIGDLRLELEDDHDDAWNSGYHSDRRLRWPSDDDFLDYEYDHDDAWNSGYHSDRRLGWPSDDEPDWNWWDEESAY